MSPHEARDIATQMIEAVIDHRADAADAALMLAQEKQLLMTRTATAELIGG